MLSSPACGFIKRYVVYKYNSILVKRFLNESCYRLQDVQFLHAVFSSQDSLLFHQPIFIRLLFDKYITNAVEQFSGNLNDYYPAVLTFDLVLEV